MVFSALYIVIDSTGLCPIRRQPDFMYGWGLDDFEGGGREKFCVVGQARVGQEEGLYYLCPIATLSHGLLPLL